MFTLVRATRGASLRTIALCIPLFLVGCGNGSDTVTEMTSPQPTEKKANSSSTGRTSTPYVPDAKLLLAKLPEASTTVYFSAKAADISVQDQLSIDPIAVRLRQHPDSYVLVIGHADEYPEEDDNIALSFERAFNVAIYISSVFGIEEERIQIVSAGSAEKGLSPASEFRRVDIISPEAIVRTFNPTHEHSF
ncbi:OmpA family protein [Photobacterium aphoticum]|nr:OmpA family protein [Photobacterium aphoticum]